jgi:hypothetical protein
MLLLKLFGYLLIVIAQQNLCYTVQLYIYILYR